jgi:carbonic anhydrase
MFFASNCQHGRCGMQVSSLEAIHNELRTLNERLDFIEDLVEEVILRQLPRAKASASAREIAVIRKSIAEMKAGERVTLEELVSA